MKKALSKLTVAFLAVILAAGVLSGCDSRSGDEKAIRIFTVGWTNNPTDSGDPYRKYIKDKYGMDAILNATSDFMGTVNIKLSDRQGGRPDLISFPDVVSFRYVQSEDLEESRRPMILDWKPYLDKMPNIKSIIESQRVNGEPSIAEKMFTDSEGRLTAIWTSSSTPVWSLKIREDWAEKFRATPGNADWQPETPQDVLDFAAFIKNTDMDGNGVKDEYAFTADGNNKDFGVLGTWVPLMFGRVNIMPWGVYIDGNDNASFGVEDGSHKATLDYLQTVVENGYIDPSWQTQNWSDKVRTKQGKIGIEWYPSTIEEECQSGASSDAEREARLGWWKTYNLPKDPAFPNAGLMPLEGYVGKIISVTKAAALDAEKMDAICKLINDVTFTYDSEAEGKAKYNRSATYDALRWGVGIEPGISYIDITDTDYVFCNTNPSQTSYRQTSAGLGAWDWGAWFSSGNDGVIQGSTSQPDAVTLKMLEHINATNSMTTFDQIGAALKFSPNKLSKIENYKNTFEVKYVKKDKPSSFSTYEAYYNDFKSKWQTTYEGTALLTQAKAQFISLGMITA